MSRRKKRNFAAEYARRKASAAKRGLSLSQARGHPRAGESGLRPMGFDAALEAALKAMRGGEPLMAAAARQRVSRERLSRYAKAQAGAARSGRTWTFDDRRKRRVQVIQNGQVVEIWVEGYEAARLAGQYLSDAGRMIENPSRLPRFQRLWEHRFIRDAAGRRIFFTIDPNEIYRALHANDRPFEQIYKLVMAE